MIVGESMTAQEAKTKLVNWCREQLGYIEGANNWNKYAPKWTEAGGWNAQNQPWCDIFVDCAFIECFGIELASRLTYQPRGGFSALCSASAQFYKNNNAWYTTPEVGDQVFFNVSGGINHTGIVVKAGGGIIETIEGNSSDAVRNNAYAFGSSYINGFGRPNWSIFSSNDTESGTTGENTTPSAPTVPQKKTCKVTATPPLLQQGDTGSWVKIMQLRLMDCGQSLRKWGADGDFGSETRDAVERFQKAKGLVVDSVVGEATWTKLLGE